MVTRLKNLIRRGKTRVKRWFVKERSLVFLAGSLMAASVCLTLAFIYYGYYQHYLDSWYHVDDYAAFSFLCMCLTLLFGSTAVYGLISGRKKYLEDMTIISPRADRIKTEILVILLCWSAWKWSRAFSPYEIYVWERYPVGERLDTTLAFVINLVLVLLVFYGSMLFLARQWCLGIMRDTSLIWREIYRYQTRTPLELRMQNRRKGALILSVLALAGGIFSALLVSGYTDGLLGMIVGGFSFCQFFLFFKMGYSGRLQREVGRLTYQIQCMTEGRPVPKEQCVPEQSVLYEASHQLLNIDTAMKKSMEKQIRTERLKIDLITNLSHDLKTPLTSMVGYTDLLKKEELGAEARDYVEVISVKQEQLKNMIQDLFDLSKATSGETQMTIEVLDMRRLLEQTLGDMEDAISESGKEIRTRYEDEPLLFKGDNGKMYRVVQNLLENALKYSMEGTRIYLEAHRNGGMVEMQLKNIASYEMDFDPEEIMERFVRGDKSRTTQGHGLGLAIALSFVQNMGGTLEVSIDGDLFKVSMRFPFCGEEKEIKENQ